MRAARQATDGWFDCNLPAGDGERTIDPSGLVKGWAAERAARALATLDHHDWLINAGGDVIVSAAGRPFAVGIQSPRDQHALIEAVRVQQGAVATSGSYARGGHIVNPRTAKPAYELGSVSVIAPSLVCADVLATAVYAEGIAGLDRVEGIPGAEALIVLSDGAVVTTSAWPQADQPVLLAPVSARRAGR